MYLQQVLGQLEFYNSMSNFCAQVWNYLVLQLLVIGTPRSGGVETTEISTPHV
jgi:hypothetical protein